MVRGKAKGGRSTTRRMVHAGGLSVLTAAGDEVCHVAISAKALRLRAMGLRKAGTLLRWPDATVANREGIPLVGTVMCGGIGAKALAAIAHFSARTTE